MIAPRLETDRLVLRPLVEDDIAHEVEFYASDRSAFVGGPMEKEQVWRMIASMIGHWVLRGYGYWAIDDKARGVYLGRAGLWNPDGWPEPEVSWAVMGHAEGRGIAYEAAMAVRAFAYGTLGWTSAISLINPDNARSIALADRMGARFEKDYMHPQYGRNLIYRHPAPAEVLQ